MSQVDFLQAYSNSIDNLKATQRRITDTIAQRADFSKKLSDGLTGIKTRIADLTTKIGGLKSTIEGMRSQLAANVATINEKEQQLQALRAQSADAQRIAVEIENLRRDNQLFKSKIEEATGTITEIAASLKTLLDSDLAQNPQNIDELLKPIKDSISNLESALNVEQSGGKTKKRKTQRSKYSKKSRTVKRRHKKSKRGNKKQKGGFIYKPTTKRPSLSASPKSASSRRNI
jgi:chromosome segregation ATPase